MLGLLLHHLVRKGTLTVTWHDGSKSIYGSGSPKAAMSIHGAWSAWTIGIRPDLALGEAYMDGRLTVEDGTIADFLETLDRPFESASDRLLHHSCGWSSR